MKYLGQEKLDLPPMSKKGRKGYLFMCHLSLCYPHQENETNTLKKHTQKPQAHLEPLITMLFLTDVLRWRTNTTEWQALGQVTHRRGHRG